ncbi:MAG: sigma-70 family RNA polymerase sigma factor [Bacilli bacterium]|nr:sigma-70 family RNA polymerase sigma factor [Bacilli bacterium]
MNQYNDYELLYLVYEGDEEALGIIFKKYDPLIKKKLYDFRISSFLYDDFYQEGLIMLFLAIKLYNPFLTKSFTRFFELLLSRRIMTLLRDAKKENEKVVAIEESILNDSSGNFDYKDKILSDKASGDIWLKDNNIPLSILTKCEKEILIMRMFKNKSASEIAKDLNINIKKVYNALYQAKKKIKQLTLS